MVTAIEHPVPDRDKPSFVIFDIWALWHSGLSVWVSAECPDVKNYKWRLNPVWHRMLYSCKTYPYGNSGRQRVNRSRIALLDVQGTIISIWLCNVFFPIMCTNESITISCWLNIICQQYYYVSCCRCYCCCCVAVNLFRSFSCYTVPVRCSFNNRQYY